MFKRVALISLCLLGLLGLLPKPATAQDLSNFAIRSFSADYYLSRNAEKTSELRIEEIIVAEFSNFDQNHGILRAIPKTYQDHTVSLKILSVTDEQGRPHKYSTSTESDNEVLKIGDDDKYVHGRVTYKIKYELKNVINFQELDEFYWDVNGNEWHQSFDEIVGRIHIPNDLRSALLSDQACFTGSFESSSGDCTIFRSSTGGEAIIEIKTNRIFHSSENLTFIIGFSKGTFQLGPEIAAEARRQKILVAAIGTSIGLPILGSSWFVFRRYRKYGKDPKGRGIIVPEYLPPKGFNSVTSETILKEVVTPKAVSAAILELAVKHYIVIYEIKKKKLFKDQTEFELELVKDPSDLPRELADVLSALFPGGAVIGARSKITDLKNKLYSTLQKLKDDSLHQLFVDGFFRTDPKTIRSKYIKIGVVMMVLSFIIGLLIVTIPFSLGLFIGGLIVLFSASTMPSKSLTGVAARDHLKGLEQYMKLAEADRINFAQGLKTAERVKANPESDAEKIKLFEKLLPYAMLFGIEKDWAKEFADLYKQPPSWYSGNVGAFNAAYLAGSLGNFGTQATSAFTSPSSSGGSGFGGGGFSGGGGGGGGGGGW